MQPQQNQVGWKLSHNNAVNGRQVNDDVDKTTGNSVVVPCYDYNDLKIDGHGEATLNFQSVHISNVGCYKLLDAVFHGGAALVNHVPLSAVAAAALPIEHVTNHHGVAVVDDENSPVAILGKTLSGGRLSHGQLYGDVFHVCDKTKLTVALGNDDSMTATNSGASNNNIAYTTLALCPHQDLAYYESIPGLQLLHCIENDINTIQGGASTLIDVISAAAEFQTLAPDLFDVLAYCEATFIKQRDGADMIYRRPHFQCSSSDKRIVSVRWSPPFEGPLLSISPNLVDDYNVAYSAFERMIDNSLPRLQTTNNQSPVNQLLPRISYELENNLCSYAYENTWEYRMKPGDLLIFNNQRMLHGRRAYTFVPAPTISPPASTSHVANATSSAGRHLMGCYTNIDDTLSQYRLLRRNYYQKQYELPYLPIVGNGSSTVP